MADRRLLVATLQVRLAKHAMRGEAGIVPDQRVRAGSDCQAVVALVHRLLGAGNKILQLH